MKRSLMKKQNWALLILGVLVNYFGFFLISFITTNYDGLYAFVSIGAVVAGLIIVVLGLSLSFETTQAGE